MMSAMFVILFVASASVQNIYLGESRDRDKLAFTFESQAVARIALWKLLNSYPPTYAGILTLPYEMELKVMNRVYNVRIEAEDSKVPVNRLNLNELMNLTDIFLGDRNKGRLIFTYLQLNGRMNSVNELYNIIGSNGFGKLKDHVTAYSPRLNLNYADEKSIRVIGLGRGDIEAIISRRKDGVVNIMDITNTFNETILLKYATSTPRPAYYRIKVRMAKPFYSEAEYILSPDMQILDRL
jgi:hypothetical protein